MLYRLQARPPAPADLRFVDRQLQLGPAPEQRLQRTGAIDARELMAKAIMNPGAEGDMPVRLAFEIEPLGMLVCPRIEVGRRQHGHNLLTLLQPDTAKLDVLAHEARLGELYGRDEAQEFLHGEIDPAPILLQPVAQAGIFQELMDRAADQMRGRFMPREQEQKEHRHHLVAADLPAFLFNAHKLGDETSAYLPCAPCPSAFRGSASSRKDSGS